MESSRFDKLVVAAKSFGTTSTSAMISCIAVVLINGLHPFAMINDVFLNFVVSTDWNKLLGLYREVFIRTAGAIFASYVFDVLKFPTDAYRSFVNFGSIVFLLEVLFRRHCLLHEHNGRGVNFGLFVRSLIDSVGRACLLVAAGRRHDE